MIETFRPLLLAAQGIDLADPDAACAALNETFAPDSPGAAALTTELKALLEAGRIADRGELPVRYGRISKASEESLGFSIDVVLMNGPGPRHRHPQGEINFCMALDGEPTFDGRPAGWVVFPPESAHVPTVAGGTMLIVYLLPEGKIEFLENP